MWIWSNILGPILIMPVVLYWMFRNRDWLFPKRVVFKPQ